MIKKIAFVASAVMIATSVCPITAHAVVSCDQFKAGLLEATTFYTYPAPKSEHMVDDNKGFQHWDVARMQGRGWELEQLRCCAPRLVPDLRRYQA